MVKKEYKLDIDAKTIEINDLRAKLVNSIKQQNNLHSENDSKSNLTKETRNLVKNDDTVSSLFELEVKHTNTNISNKSVLETIINCLQVW